MHSIRVSSTYETGDVNGKIWQFSRDSVTSYCTPSVPHLVGVAHNTDWCRG